MMLTKQNVLEHLAQVREHLRVQYGVRRIGIFGSVARSESNGASDLDVLVEMENPTFDRYMGLKFELEDSLGVSVDLVLADAVKERLRPIIEREVLYA